MRDETAANTEEIMRRVTNTLRGIPEQCVRMVGVGHLIERIKKKLKWHVMCFSLITVITW